MAYNVADTVVETQLQALSTISDVDVSKTGQEFTIVFNNPATNVSDLTADKGTLAGGATTVTVA